MSFESKNILEFIQEIKGEFISWLQTFERYPYICYYSSQILANYLFLYNQKVNIKCGHFYTEPEYCLHEWIELEDQDEKYILDSTFIQLDPKFEEENKLDENKEHFHITTNLKEYISTDEVHLDCDIAKIAINFKGDFNNYLKEVKTKISPSEYKEIMFDKNKRKLYFKN